MTAQQSLIQKTKISILKKIYILVIGANVINILGSLYLLYELFITQTSEYDHIPDYVYITIGTFPIPLIGYFIIKKWPKISAWIVCCFIMVFFTDAWMLHVGFGIPIILSSLIISPLSSFAIAFLLCLQGSYVYFMVEEIPFAFVDFYENYLVFYLVALVFAFVAFLLSRELYKTLYLYDKQNLELQEARNKLSKKVETQSKEIETIQEEKERLSDKLSSMRDSLEQLKAVTRQRKKTLS